MSLTKQVETAIDQTFVVVITFKPDLTALDRQLSSLARAGLSTVVVDNGSPSQHEIAGLAEMHSVEVVLVGENLGVAGAQNIGVDHARRRNSRYVVLLDQDSVPESGALEQLLRAYLSLRAQHKIGAVGSSYTLRTGTPGSSFVRFRWCGFSKIYCDDGDNGLHEVDFLISSGTLIPMAVLDEIGDMKEELFIDHVDTEWFLRAKASGFRFFGSCLARMSHDLGKHNYRVWLGRWRTVPVHQAFRYFFMFRNSIWLYRQRYAPAKWISADIVRLIYIFLFAGLLVPSGWPNIKWMLAGAWAGLRGLEDPRSIDAAERVKGSILSQEA